MGEVGGIDRDDRTTELFKIREGRPVEHRPVVHPLHEIIRADPRIDQPCQVPWQQIDPPDIAFRVTVEKAGLEPAKGASR